MSISFFVVISLFSSLNPSAQEREDAKSYRFYEQESEGRPPKNELLAYELWSGEPRAPDSLEFEPGRTYLVGVERDIEPADRELLDLSFTDPKEWSFEVEGTLPKKTYSRESSVIYDHGVFFPSQQTDVVWDGIVRWVWSEGVRIEPLKAGNMVSFGSLRAKKTPFLRDLACPVLRGNELEIQVVVKEGRPLVFRKVFKVSGTEGKLPELGLSAVNRKKEIQFENRLGPVRPEEKEKPDAVLTVKRAREDFWSMFRPIGVLRSVT